MDILDLLIVAAVGLLGFIGFRRGLSWGGLSTLGLIVGAVVGALVAPPVTRFLTPKSTASPGATHPNQPLVTAGIFLACVLIIQGIGTAVGFRFRVKTLRTRFATWDSVAGAGAGGVGVLVLAWFLGFVLASGDVAWMSDEVRGSAVEHALLGVVPKPPAFLAKVQQYLRNNSDLPNPFTGLGGGDLPPQPIPATVDTPAVAGVAHVVSRVIATGDSAKGCDGAEAGSAWPIGNDRMVTNAHVVAGSNHVEVDPPGRQPLTATVVLYDPDVDVAVLNVSGLDMSSLTISPDVPDAGTTGAAIGYPGGGAQQTTPAAVRGSENAQGWNIYGDNYVTRNIVVVSANIIPGDSGGPLIDLNGNVIGLTFASSTVHPGEGYALSVPQITDDVTAGRSRTGAIDTGSCINP
jgi:uncharacterized membrane protein required for colicin V production